ncbi:MAG: hypothetical protein HUU38_03595 [Anaerolineales bacterium]|nr:hypothetical protein [Anaerolineales bacterium]
MTLANELSQKTLNAIISRFNLTEVGDPYRTIKSQLPMAMGVPVGKMRIFKGEGFGSVSKLVYIGLTVPPIGLDSHMIFAFTDAQSAVPHFTLDSVKAGDSFAFHLDLIPRVDLGANLAYLDYAFHPLTDEYEKARKIDGLTEARLSPRQYAIMSPWMLAFRATEDAYRAVEPSIDFYLDHWAGLVESNLARSVLASLGGVDLAERDARNRNAIFNRDVDKVWNQITPMIGNELAEEMIGVLKNQGVEEN